ncbi:MAG: DUF3313 domain-containing protein [Syntrophotaleaceae bacterium]
MKKSAFKHILPTLLVAVLLGACSPPQEDFRYSEFLGDYSGFKAVKKARGAEGYAKPDLDLSGYDRIMVDPIILMVGDDERLAKADLRYLAESFHEALVSELGQSFVIADQPGQGVLRLRTALTEAIPKDTVGMVSDPSRHSDRPRLAPKGEQPDIEVPVSVASMEMELLDSSTGERLAAIKDRKGGPASETSPQDTMQEIFDFWATSTNDILVSLRNRGAR